MIGKNKARINLWHEEVLRLIGVYNDFFCEFDLNLYECSMERITFCNDVLFIHFTYSYDRYQMERNLEMPLGMIFFGDGTIQKNLIDVFKDNVPSIDIYELIGSLNQQTNDLSLSYKQIITEHIIPVIKKGTLFNL